MRARFFQLDAFTTHQFAGNPAAVMVLDVFPDDTVLQAIAAENNLAETAFLVEDGQDYRIRWFTPTVEVPLCGHATLASAAVVIERLAPGTGQVRFHSASGILTVRRDGPVYAMDFPARSCTPIAAPPGMAAALGAEPTEIWWDGSNLIALMADAATVRRLEPDLAGVARLPAAGVVATAAGEGDHDCVSRYFAPAKGIAEDPVTGGAHCALAPLWAARLGKTEIKAWQASPRGGALTCRVMGDRVELRGACRFYLEGVAIW